MNMGMSDYQKSKFVFSETFNNSDGKTSGSGFVGVILGIIVSLAWIAGTIGMYLDIPFETLNMFFSKTLALGGTVALLLGARKIVSAVKGKNNAS